MKKLIAAVGILIFSSFTFVKPPGGVLSGEVIDNNDGKPVTGATIEVSEAGRQIKIVSSDNDGRFSLTLKPGSYIVKASAKGYENKQLNVFVKEDKTTSITIKLEKEKVIIDKEAAIDGEVYFLVELVESDMAVAHDATITGYGTMKRSDMPHQHFNTDEYDFINENIFKDALTNPLSTFSIDVDRASYSNLRRFLNQNRMPYKDAIRVEELINYFDYDYAQPNDGHPFSVTLEAGECPWNKENQLVMVGLKGENKNEASIPPNNLVFLIDVSGSMSPHDRLPLLKQAFKYLVDQLRPQDRVSIVVYAGSVGIVLESTPGDQKEKIHAAIDMLKAGGYTSGGEGIQQAYRVAKQNFIHGGNNRVILATDGDFNVGVSSTSELVKLVKEKSKDNIYLTTLGFGMGNYKDSRMKQLSMAGNGNYAYIDNMLEAKKMFGSELWGTLYTIANDVKIQVEFNPAKVKAYRLIGYENRLLNEEDFNDDAKDAGDIGCGHTVTALYEIIPADSDADIPGVDPLKYTDRKLIDSNEILTAKIRYKKPGEETSNLIVHSLDADKMKSTANLQFASAVAEFGMLLRESEFKGQASFDNVLERAKAHKGNDEYGYKDEFTRLVQIAKMMYR